MVQWEGGGGSLEGWSMEAGAKEEVGCVSFGVWEGDDALHSGLPLPCLTPPLSSHAPPSACASPHAAHALSCLCLMMVTFLAAGGGGGGGSGAAEGAASSANKHHFRFPVASRYCILQVVKQPVVIW